MTDWGWKSKLRMETPDASKFVQLSKFKLYLDESNNLKSWDNVVPISTAISDYLKALHEYVKEKILNQFGSSYSQNKFRYCLTVPAIWSDKAKNVMRKAAIQADLITESDHPDRLSLVSEPEAAALYCERACKQFDLKHGDQFMICDAGGGTVDLIVYKVDSSTGKRHLSEVTKGHGASCGSMFIDLNLSNLLTEKFGRLTKTPIPKKTLSNLIDAFAYQLKPQFDGEDDQYLPIPRDSYFDEIDNPRAIGIDGGFMCLDAVELKDKVFEPVVKQVLKLIDQQLTSAKKCSAIFMVGGFGSSSYLLRRVKEEFGSRVGLITSPYKPEMAVVCGAVYAGMNSGIVTSRVTRRCYGIALWLPFESGVDPIGLKQMVGLNPWCYDRFGTLVRKGENVKVDNCVNKTYSFMKAKHIEDWEVTLYSIDGDPPRYTTDDGVVKLANISVSDPFEASAPIGHKVKFDLKLYFGLNEIKVDVHSMGKKYSSTLKFE
ncbi:Heat shock 70 kDa protein 12A [Entomortierella beljakovae]|nr:Heat shock 70 kDa protein 12A [Entomortierella beljakovae]